MPCHGLACAKEQSGLAACTLHVQSDVRPYLNWYRQEGDEQQVLSVGDQAIIVNIKHLEEVAVLQQQHKLFCRCNNDRSYVKSQAPVNGTA